jgi:hypothetical protein
MIASPTHKIETKLNRDISTFIQYYGQMKLNPIRIMNKSPLLKAIIPGVLALFAILALTGCLEESTVVKISNDGSGVIHTRKYENTQAGKGLLGGLGGGEDKEEKEIDAPTEEELKAKARTMGEGVTFTSLRKGKNKSGWTGYEAIYAFKDINKVKLELNMKDADDMKQPEADQEAPDEENGGESELVTFEMKDGLLKIRTPDPAEEGKGKEKDQGEQNDPAEGAQDPFGEEGGDPQMMAMMAPMFAGAKVGFFVEIDGGIAETNAKHQEGNMITIMRADLGKLFANPGAINQLNGMEGKDRQGVQKIVDSIEGIDMDLQDPITVKLK